MEMQGDIKRHKLHFKKLIKLNSKKFSSKHQLISIVVEYFQ